MIKPKKSTVLENYSNEYELIYGSYEWLNSEKDEKFNFVTLVGNVPFSSLNDDLRILNEINETNSLGFDLLVQRDIDTERVEEELIHFYLKNRNKLNFFPPIVVALVPKFETILDKKFKLEVSLEENELNIVSNDKSIVEKYFLDEDEDKELPVPELLTNNLRICSVKWNKDRVNGIVIDGQHRFFALKKFLKEKNQIDNPKNLLPVNFVILHPKMSVISEEFNGTEYIRAARELFIDINKNAKSVSNQRLILLDDKSLERTLTRGAIRQFNRVEIEDSNFYKWENFKDLNYLNQIPQEITAWNIPEDTSIKTSEGHKLFQITSTTLIYDIITEFILEKSKSDSIFDNLKSSLELSRVDKEVNDEAFYSISLLEQKQSDYDEKVTYINDEEEANRDTDYYNPDIFRRKKDRLIENAFMFDRRSNLWLTDWFYSETFNGKFISSFFTGFKPYNNLLKKLEIIFKDLNKYENLINIIVDPKDGNKLSFLNKLNQGPEKEKFQELWEFFEDENNLPKDVTRRVFQMAVFSEISTTKNISEYLFGESDNKLAAYIISLNNLFDLSIFDKNLSVDLNKTFFEGSKVEITNVTFWLGVWIDSNNQIKYRETDAKRIGDMIRVLVWLNESESNFKDENHHLFASMRSKLVNNATNTYLKLFKNKLEVNTQDDVLHELGITREEFKSDILSIYDEMINIKLNKKSVS